MAQPPYGQRGGDPNSGPRLLVDAGRLWMGGLVTAVVAALVAVVGVLIARGLFDVPLERSEVRPAHRSLRRDEPG